VAEGIEEQRFGEALGDFSLPSLSGDEIALSSVLAGKRGGVVVIWSSTCSHCLRYDKYLNAFEGRHPELSLTVVSARVGETLEAARKAASQRKLAFRLLHDPTSIVAKQWFTQQTPRAFLMDADRNMSATWNRPSPSFWQGSPSRAPRLPATAAPSSPFITTCQRSSRRVYEHRSGFICTAWFAPGDEPGNGAVGHEECSGHHK
jgi:peroxiredoxin